MSSYFYTNSATDHNYYYYCYYYYNYYATDMDPQNWKHKNDENEWDFQITTGRKKLQLVFWKENGLACFPKCLKLWGETTFTLK